MSTHTFRTVIRDSALVMHGSLLLLGTIFLNDNMQAQSVEFDYGVNGNLVVKEVNIDEKTFNITGPSTACSGETIELAISTDEPAIWPTGEVSNSMSVLIDKDTLINAVILNSFGCAFESTLQILVKELPQKPIIERHGDTLIVLNVSGEFTWYRNGNIYSTGLNYVITNLPSTYSVEVTNAEGCSKLSDDFEFTTTSVNDATTRYKIYVYPNPAANRIYINTDESSTDLDLHIMDMYGKSIVLNQLSAGVQSVDISSLVPGAYILVFRGDNHQVDFVKLIKN